MLHHQNSLTAAIVLLCCLAFPGNLSASHPYHTSLSEIDWNPNTGNFEVAICVWPADLEEALSASSGKPVSLDSASDDEIDEHLQAYVVQHFQIVPAARGLGAALRLTPATRVVKPQQPFPEAPKNIGKIRWVGHEIELQQAWLYFEISGNGNSDEWEISNEMFFELNEEQLNLVQITTESKTESVSLSSKNRSVIFEKP